MRRARSLRGGKMRDPGNEVAKACIAPGARVTRVLNWNSTHEKAWLPLNSQRSIDVFVLRQKRKKKPRGKRIRPLTIQVQILNNADTARLIVLPESVFDPMSEAFWNIKLLRKEDLSNVEMTSISSLVWWSRHQFEESFTVPANRQYLVSDV